MRCEALSFASEEFELAREMELNGGSRMVTDGDLEDDGPTPGLGRAGSGFLHDTSSVARGRVGKAGVFSLGGATPLLVDDVASTVGGAGWTPDAKSGDG